MAKKTKKTVKAKKAGTKRKKTTTKSAAKKKVAKTKPAKAKRAAVKVSKPKRKSVAKSKPKVTNQQANNTHPGMMGDGTEEQNLNQQGNPEARITQDDVDEAFKKPD